MNKKPKVGSMVQLKNDNTMKAQVRKHYIDNDDIVAVIVLPQSGISGNNRFQDWWISDISNV